MSSVAKAVAREVVRASGVCASSVDKTAVAEACVREMIVAFTRTLPLLRCNVTSVGATSSTAARLEVKAEASKLSIVPATIIARVVW